MPEQPSLLVYDENCTYCVRFTRMLRCVDFRKRFHFLTYQSPTAQQILSAQFGQRIGFTLYLFKGRTVYWAQSAAREAVAQLGLPLWVGGIAFKAYPALVRVVSRFTRRGRAVCMPGPDRCINTQMAFGTMKLSDRAVVQLGALKIPNTHAWMLGHDEDQCCN